MILDTAGADASLNINEESTVRLHGGTAIKTIHCIVRRLKGQAY
jgi:hypothetical protein